MQLHQFLEDFIAYMKADGLDPHTIYQHKRVLIKAVFVAVGGKTVENLKRLEHVKVKEEGRKHGSSGERHAILTYRKLLGFVEDSGYKLDFDWHTIPIPREIQKEVISLDKDDITLIRQELSSISKGLYRDRRSFSNLRTRALVELGLHTGLRLSECLTANRKDIDWEKETIDYINCKTGKKRTKSIVGATEHIKEYMNARVDDCEALFIGTKNVGMRLKEDGIKSIFRELKVRLKAAGLRKNFHFHMLRKTYVTFLLRGKVDLKSVQYLADHASERTTLRYYTAVNNEYSQKENDRVMKDV